MEPLVVSPIVYVLELEDGKIYVGITLNFNIRLAQHISGSGAKWTRLYKPKKVLEIIHEGITAKTENEVTLRYKELYGSENVRGGYYTKP
jgi:predicted GIY-YIG superfamily endonuclease